MTRKSGLEHRPRKQFAQHWLKSDKVLNQIIRAAQVTECDRVLEIGPGTGALTRRLLPLAQSVVAVEIDRDLCQLLTKQLSQFVAGTGLAPTGNFLLLQGDILSLDLASQLASFPAFQKQNKVVANIPYNITGPILEKLLGKISNPVFEPFDLIVLLVQKEVAERLYARPGSKAFGALSVRVQYLAECELVCPVPAGNFYPPPKVDSAVVRLHPRPTEPPALDPQHLETLVKVGFAAKRKMLRNNLKGIVDRDCLTHLLEKLEVNPQVRAEDLSVAQWVALSNNLCVPIL